MGVGAAVSQGGGNSAGMMLSRVLKFCGSREGEEKSGGFLCRPGCDDVSLIRWNYWRVIASLTSPFQDDLDADN